MNSELLLCVVFMYRQFLFSTKQDWWNSNSFASYYRMWNVVVHDWLYAYIYRDALYILGDKYRGLAATGVFLISAVVHEYILGLTFRFFYPALFFMFGGVGCKFILFPDNSNFHLDFFLSKSNLLNSANKILSPSTRYRMYFYKNSSSVLSYQCMVSPISYLSYQATFHFIRTSFLFLRNPK